MKLYEVLKKLDDRTKVVIIDNRNDIVYRSESVRREDMKNALMDDYNRLLWEDVEYIGIECNAFRIEL